MNLKSKIFGTLAASAFALSMSAGIASADQATGTAVLDGVNCSVEVTSADLNFGSWVWNPETDSYTPPTGNSAKAFVYEVTPGSPSGTCTVNFQFQGLANTSDSSQTIGLAYFSGDMGVTGLSGNMSGWNGTYTQDEMDGTYNGSLTLSDVPDTIDPGTYQGNVYVNIASTQN